MNSRFRLCIVALLAVWMPIGSAQGSAPEPEKSEKAQREQVKREADQAMDAIRSYSVERRKEALERARRAAEEIDRRIERLQTQMDQGWEEASKASRARSQQAMAGLRQRRNDLAEWYGGMRHGSREAWGEVRAGFVRSYDELAEALRKARAEFEQAQDAPASQPPSSQPPGKDERKQ